MAFAGQQDGVVRNPELLQLFGEGLGERHGDDGVVDSVQEEGGRKAWCSQCVVGRSQAAGYIDDGPDASCWRRSVGGGKFGCERKAQKGVQGKTGDNNAGGIDPGTRCDEAKCVVDGVEPLGYMDAVGEHVGVGPPCTGAVEIVRSVQMDTGLCQNRTQLSAPEIDVAAGAVQKKDSRTRRCGFVGNRGGEFLGGKPNAAIMGFKL